MSKVLLESARRAHELGNLNEAARLYADVLRANAGDFDALFAFGRLHYERGAFEDARRLLGEALRRNPKSADALCAHGMTLLSLNRAGQALGNFDEALAIDGMHQSALLGRANALRLLRRYNEAIESYDSYLDWNPNSAEAWHNRGIAFCELGRMHEAVESLTKAITLAPDSAQSWHNRGLAHTELKDFESAARDEEMALALDPDLPFARGYLIFAKLSGCDWRALEQERALVKDGLTKDKPVAVPFGNLMVSESPADQRLCVEVWMRRYATLPPPLWRGERYRHDRIRVAYVSGDFRQHAVAFLIAGVFEHHDRSRFETIGVSFGHDDKSGIRRRVAGAFEHFVDARTKSDLDVAAILRSREVDIAIDLMGPTAHCRAGIFTCRPAPVQVNYLGYPGTMACPFMDYIIADAHVILPEEERHYGERIAYLPDTYLPTDDRHPKASAPARSEAGLPENGFVFCAFNNVLKYGPEVFASWMCILAAVPASVLWLPQQTNFAEDNLKREAQAAGVAPQRIVFAPYVKSQAEHIARLSLADLFLDTLPCNAHTNAADALWAGVPVLTCKGTTFAGRVAASQLNAIGLPELVTNTLVDYQNLAISLAKGPERLAAIRQKLGENRKTKPLFDTARYTRNLERAFTQMHALASRGESPRSFHVADAAG
jgi:predicted O-linked N-acetylglucosamine transferase (SPINDLY family)